MGSSHINEEDRQRIGIIARGIAAKSIDRRSVAHAHPVPYLPPALSLFEALEYLLGLDDRLMRYTIIQESASPRNVDKIGGAHVKEGEILISFTYLDERSGEAECVNFALDVKEDLATLEGLYLAISSIQDHLSEVLDITTV